MSSTTGWAISCSACTPRRGERCLINPPGAETHVNTSKPLARRCFKATDFPLGTEMIAKSQSRKAPVTTKVNREASFLNDGLSQWFTMILLLKHKPLLPADFNKLSCPVFRRPEFQQGFHGLAVAGFMVGQITRADTPCKVQSAMQFLHKFPCSDSVVGAVLLNQEQKHGPWLSTTPG